MNLPHCASVSLLTRTPSTKKEEKKSEKSEKKESKEAKKTEGKDEKNDNGASGPNQESTKKTEEKKRISMQYSHVSSYWICVSDLFCGHVPALNVEAKQLNACFFRL